MTAKSITISSFNTFMGTGVYAGGKVKGGKFALRCKYCKHLVAIHKVNNRGRYKFDGFCEARYCLCPYDRKRLLEGNY